MEPHRSFPGDGDQRWYDGEDWERGRHGAPLPPAAEGAAYSGGGTGNAGFGEARPADGYERPDGYERGYSGARFGEAEVPGPRFGDSDPPGRVGMFGPDPVSAAPMSGPGGDPVEASRHPVEAIDVGALRRPPVSSPPVQQPGPYGPPPAEYPPPYSGPPAYSGPAQQPLYPADQQAVNTSFSAPTAAVSTIQPAVYQSRKPAVLIVLAVLTVLLEIPALRLLISATIEDVVSVSGVVSGVFLVAGLPAFAYGLYGLLGGGAVTTSVAPWLKAPLVYLPVGALLLLLAALAAA